MGTKKCNYDCLNCPFPDCINDEDELPTYQDLKRIRDEEKQRKIEDEIADPNTSTKRRYELLHRDKSREASRRYAEAHRDYKRKYDEEHREEINARHRQYYREHREISLAYDRDKRRAEKRARDNNPLRNGGITNV